MAFRVQLCIIEDHSRTYTMSHPPDHLVLDTCMVSVFIRGSCLCLVQVLDLEGDADNYILN